MNVRTNFNRHVIRVVRHFVTQLACNEVKSCEVVTYWRLKTTENFKQSALKVSAVAYKMWLFLGGFNYNDLSSKILLFWKVVAYETQSHIEV